MEIVSFLLFIFLSSTSSAIVTTSGKIDSSESEKLKKTCGKQFSPKAVREIRSMGGAKVQKNQYPWVLGVSGPKTKCSAALISRRHILTSAHCLADRRLEIGCKNTAGTPLKELYSQYPFDVMHVVPGTRDVFSWEKDRKLTAYTVKNVTIHPGYNACSGMYDLALLEFTPNMDSEGSPICMPKKGEDLPDGEERLTAAGFGDNPDHPGVFALEAVNLTFDSSYDTRLVTKTTGKSVCYGDSGGPLFKLKKTLKWTLLGITTGYSNCDKRTPNESLLIQIMFKRLIIKKANDKGLRVNHSLRGASCIRLHQVSSVVTKRTSGLCNNSWCPTDLLSQCCYLPSNGRSQFAKPYG